MISEAQNINTIWARLIVEELVRCGVTMFFVAPGSRSTPLTAAAAQHPKARVIVHFDERGTAFAALGYGRATRWPAVWITTSGTAVANGLPAVVEASIDTVPLLLITADRPPELRQTGANQTIRQPDIFGDYISWRVDAPPPSVDIPASFVLTTIDQAVHRTRSGAGGPVHLNWMFREPLAPSPDGQDYRDYGRSFEAWETRNQPFTTYTASQPTADVEGVGRLAQRLNAIEKGVIIAGRLKSTEEGQAVAAVAEKLRWPLFADIGSQVRLGSGPGMRVPFYDVLFADPVHPDIAGPEAVLHFGRRGASSELYRWIDRTSPRLYAVIDSYPDRFDPWHGVTHRAESEVEAFCTVLSEQLAPPTSSWLERWQRHGDKATGVVEAMLEEEDRLSEPLVARLLSEELRSGDALVVGNSMPVRDMDAFAVFEGHRVPVAVNRGASGIDGTLATAVGFAHGRRVRTTVLLGDLSLLHDLNSLAMLGSLPAPVIIVVINNNGGGIFSFLPIASHTDVFEPFFGTPHNLQFREAAGMFELPYYLPATREAFVRAYREAANASKSSIIEVVTDRRENHALHLEIHKKMHDAMLE